MMRICALIALAAIGCDGTSESAGDTAPAGPSPFARPQALLFVGDRLLVGNTHLDGATLEYGRGSVSVIDPSDGRVVHTLPSTQTNPQRFVAHDGYLYVVSTGAYDFSDPRAPTSSTPGGIDVYALDELESAIAPSHNVEIRAPDTNPSLGGPVDLAFVGDVGVITLGIANAVLLYDSTTEALTRGVDNPIWYGGDEWRVALGSVTGGDGVAYVTDFNTDHLHVLDVAAGEMWRCSVELGKTPEIGEGAQTPRRDGDTLYVTLALAGAVQRIDLETLARPDPDVDGPCGGAAVDTVVSPLGQLPNDLQVRDEGFYVVHSGDNNVVFYDRGGEEARRWVLDPGANPWHVAVSDDGRWMAVTEFLGDAVVIYDLEDGTSRRVP